MFVERKASYSALFTFWSGDMLVLIACPLGEVIEACPQPLLKLKTKSIGLYYKRVTIVMTVACTIIL